MQSADCIAYPCGGRDRSINAETDIAGRVRHNGRNDVIPVLQPIACATAGDSGRVFFSACQC